MSAKLLKRRADQMQSIDRCSPTLSGTQSSDPGDKTPTFHLPPRDEGPFQVLVVDDAPLIVKMTTMLLQRKGHTVQHAVNGAEALEKLNVRAESSRRTSLDDDAGGDAAPLFDVVLMDLQMPVLDGIEAIRRLRASEESRFACSPAGTKRDSGRQFVIALSANSDEETRQEALKAGADAFVPKPFTYESFVDVMQSQLT
jgi:CheY-like chemotaxis protein